jgi:hypothetical protein
MSSVTILTFREGAHHQSGYFTRPLSLPSYFVLSMFYLEILDTHSCGLNECADTSVEHEGTLTTNKKWPTTRSSPYQERNK